MYRGTVLSGTIASNGAGSGAVYSLLPAQNATGNWVNLTQQFPVHIALGAAPAGPAVRLRIGSRVTFTASQGRCHRLAGGGTHAIPMVGMERADHPQQPKRHLRATTLGLGADSVEGAAQLTAQTAAQASMLAFQDVFWLTGWAGFLMMPVVLILQRPKSGAVGAPAVQ